LEYIFFLHRNTLQIDHTMLKGERRPDTPVPSDEEIDDLIYDIYDEHSPEEVQDGNMDVIETGDLLHIGNSNYTDNINISKEVMTADETSPLLGFFKDWSKRRRRKHEPQLPWYYSQHMVLIVVSMILSLSVLTVVHKAFGAGGYRVFSADNSKGFDLGIGLDDDIDDRMVDNFNTPVEFEMFEEETVFDADGPSSSYNSTYDSNDDTDHTEDGNNHTSHNKNREVRGEDREKVYCDVETGKGPCIQNFFGICVAYADCLPYDSSMPTSYPTSAPSTSMPSTLFKCDPNNPPCKVKSVSGIGCAEHHTCLSSEYNTSTPSSSPTPMPSSADNGDCNPLKPPCKYYFISSIICYEYASCERPINATSSMIPTVNQNEGEESLYVSNSNSNSNSKLASMSMYTDPSNNNNSTQDGGGDDEQKTKNVGVFTMMPTHAPTPMGPCNPNDPESQPCRHSLFGLCIERYECSGRNMTIQEQINKPQNRLHYKNGTEVTREENIRAVENGDYNDDGNGNDDDDVNE